MSERSNLEQNLTIKKIDNETVNISINNNDMLMAIVGQFDQNLKSLSKLTNTDVYFRGNSITCKGDKEKLSIFCDSIKFLLNKYFLTTIIDTTDIVLSLKNKLKVKYSNVKIHFNTKCLEIDIETKIACFQSFDSEKQFTVQADVIFGTDGAGSSLRKS